MDLLPLVFSGGWVSGVNAYLTLLVLGIVDRVSDVSEVPDVLGRTDVLLLVGLLCAVEFVADKVPFVDSTWDAISTVVRPTVGTVLALMVSGDATSVQQAAYAVLGGGTALASHAVKAGGRLAINTSPEPFSNVVASLAEDATVVGVILLAIQHPWLAASICAVLLVAGLVLLRVLLRVVRRGWARWKGRPAPA